MRKIINRKTGEFLSLEEARKLCFILKAEFSVIFLEHRSIYGHTSPEIAKKADLASICERYEGDTFAYIGTVYEGFGGYKACVIAIKNLPDSDFEAHYPDFQVIE